VASQKPEKRKAESRKPATKRNASGSVARVVSDGAKNSRKKSAEKSDKHVDELLHKLSDHQIEQGEQNQKLQKMQVELEKSVDRYQDLYEYAPVGYLTLNHEGLITELNLTCAAIFQVERNNLIHKKFSKYVAPEYRDQWLSVFDHALQLEENHYIELEILRADGSRLYVQIDNMHLLRLGQEVTVRLTLLDVTRHYQALASERRLGLILDNTLDQILIFEPKKLRFVYANKGAIQGIGYSKDEMLQMTPMDLLPMVTEPECRSFIFPLANGRKKVRRFETMVTRKGGKELPVELQLQLIREDNNDPGLYVTIMRDITRRRRAEWELRNQKNLMWQVIDSDPNMIVVKDDEGRILLANQAMAKRYDLPIQELIGKTIYDLKPDPVAAEKVMASDREVIEAMHDLIETQTVRIHGQSHWFNFIKRPLMQDDGSVLLLGIGVDVSELKITVEKLAESYRELQRLVLYQENVREEERTEIARNLHDEMGATLAALKMRIAWLSSKLASPSFDKSILVEETDHISDLVTEGIKTMRRVVSDLRPNLLDDVGLLEAIRDYARRFEHDTDIKCTVIHPEQSCPIDQKQAVTVFRIIQESLNNVAKHARAGRVEIRFTLDDGNFLLQITDNGVGFDPSSKVRTYGLLGIKERALMIGGEAWITSEPGNGTQVSLMIDLPKNLQAKLI